MALSKETLKQIEKFVNAVADDWCEEWKIEHQILINDKSTEEYGEYGIWRRANMSDLLEMYRDLIPSGKGTKEEDEWEYASTAFDMLRSSIGDDMEDDLFTSLYDDFSGEFDTFVFQPQGGGVNQWKDFQEAREEYEVKTWEYFEERLPDLGEERVDKMAEEAEIRGSDFHDFYLKHAPRLAVELTREFEREELPRLLEEFDDEYIFTASAEDEQ